MNQSSQETNSHATSGSALAAHWWTLFCAALQFLTITPPLVRRKFSDAELGQAVGFYPAVGLVLGLVLACLNLLFTRLWPPSVSAAMLLICWVLLTGALHLDGFLDSCDGMFGGQTPEDRLRIMRDHHVGAFAVLGGVLLLLAKYTALAAQSQRGLAIVAAAVLARWGLALAIVNFPYARAEGLGRQVKDHVGKPQVILASVIALSVALLSGGGWGLLAFCLAGGATWALANLVLRRLPGLTGDIYGAITELHELLVLLAILAGETT